jgi:hypothetical protein
MGIRLPAVAENGFLPPIDSHFDGLKTVNQKVNKTLVLQLFYCVLIQVFRATATFSMLSQRDFIIQPRVGPSRTGEELPWVIVQNKFLPQRGCILAAGI